jgi:hypothetical protein
MERQPQPPLPPRIAPTPEPTPGLPPRIERGAEAPAQPPRIERQPQPELPPRIGRTPEPESPPAPAEPGVAPTQDDTVYRPRHARTDVDAAPRQAEPEPPDEEPSYSWADERERPAVSTAEGRPPVAPRPSTAGTWRPASRRSTVRSALLPHARFVTVVLVALVAVGVGYFVLRVHHRISESSLESKISQRDHPQQVRCSALQSNGSAWACAIVYRAEAQCVIARVSVLGSWSTVARAHRCAKFTKLVELLPQKITAAAVAADVDQLLGVAGLTCRKVPQHEVRWACGLPPAPGGQCLVVRELRWELWPAEAGGRLCDHFPELETAIRASQGEG